MGIEEEKGGNKLRFGRIAGARAERAAAEHVRVVMQAAEKHLRMRSGHRSHGGAGIRRRGIAEGAEGA